MFIFLFLMSRDDAVSKVDRGLWPWQPKYEPCLHVVGDRCLKELEEGGPSFKPVKVDKSTMRLRSGGFIR